jgi:hypothetical protein
MTDFVAALFRIEALARHYVSTGADYLTQTSKTGKSWNNQTEYSVPSEISRGQLEKSGRSLSVPDFAEFFVHVMAWGHGPAGYAAFRTRRVIDEIRRLTGMTEDALTGWMSKLQSVAAQGPDESFAFLRGDGYAKFLGPAFSTKLLYFMSPVGKRLPIFDSVVSRWLRNLGVADGTRPLEASHDNPGDYLNYIDFCDSASARVGEMLPDPERTDRGFIEYLIFNDQMKIDVTDVLPEWIKSFNPAEELSRRVEQSSESLVLRDGSDL